MAGSLTWNSIVMPGMSRFLISACLMVIFFVSLSTLRISPSVMSVVLAWATAMSPLRPGSAAFCAMAATDKVETSARSAVEIVVFRVFMRNPSAV